MNDNHYEEYAYRIQHLVNEFGEPAWAGRENVQENIFTWKLWKMEKSERKRVEREKRDAGRTLRKVLSGAF